MLEQVNQLAQAVHLDNHPRWHDLHTGDRSPRDTGALRRQSMELTRVLAALRNPNHG